MIAKFFQMSVLAAAVAISGGAAAMETRTLVSDTWKPGYTKDDGGVYVRHVADDRAPGRVLRIEQRDSWAPGFTADEGEYRRFVAADAPAATVQSVQVEQSDVWAPGFTHDDGKYVRTVSPAASTSQLADAEDGDHGQ